MSRTVRSPKPRLKILTRPRTQRRYSLLAHSRPAVSVDEESEIITIAVTGKEKIVVIEVSFDDWSDFYGEVFDAMPDPR